MSEQGNFIGGPNGGIPEYVFRPDFGKQSIIGVSGKELLCEVRDRKIEIMPTDNVHDTLFFGYVNRNGHLGLNINNRNPRHPDIYAGKLVHRFVEYAEENNIPITAIEGSWTSLGDNYQTFVQYLDKIATERKITEDDERGAANETWTGLLAHSLGYRNTVILDNGRESNVVKTRFSKAQTIFVA